uniref:Uncharacterized protein n=1 Tax=Amorphochlora amoebiformis TaxID=1561963 RepID=A0A7S0DQJ1_9EUKA|mmetsp:Transcript_6255/g.9564  ORF Transcript_6255/g.9564 Transcript_6255/m.9564 type:complete len:228 (+) Transcript_6255:122-805(+)
MTNKIEFVVFFLGVLLSVVTIGFNSDRAEDWNKNKFSVVVNKTVNLTCPIFTRCINENVSDLDILVGFGGPTKVTSLDSSCDYEDMQDQLGVVPITILIFSVLRVSLDITFFFTLHCIRVSRDDECCPDFGGKKFFLSIIRVLRFLVVIFFGLMTLLFLGTDLSCNMRADGFKNAFINCLAGFDTSADGVNNFDNSSRLFCKNIEITFATEMCAVFVDILANFLNCF